MQVFGRLTYAHVKHYVGAALALTRDNLEAATSRDPGYHRAPAVKQPRSDVDAGCPAMPSTSAIRTHVLTAGPRRRVRVLFVAGAEIF